MRLYKTTQIDLNEFEQLRITAGDKTVFVYYDDKGLHMSRGIISRIKAFFQYKGPIL